MHGYIRIRERWIQTNRNRVPNTHAAQSILLLKCIDGIHSQAIFMTRLGSWNPSWLWHCCPCRPCARWIVEQAFGLALLPIKFQFVEALRERERERERESSRCGCLSKVRVAICVGCVRSSTGVTDAHSSVWIADFFFIFFLFHIKLHTRQWRAARQWNP